MMNEISPKQVRINDVFWSSRQKLATDVVIPYQEKILHDEIPGAEKSHAVANFRIAAGMEEGEFYGMVFQDSDVAKWLEAVAYSLMVKPDADLEKRADEMIDIIEKAQQPDGYLNTYFTIKEPEHRWQNLLECHELYCAGHMMEAAAAYYQATGKDKLLHVMERMAEHIGSQFGPDKRHGIPGHQEVELGLLRLYQVTGKQEYLDLASYFIDERGQNPHFFEEEVKKRDWNHFGMNPADTRYNQSFAPVREQKTAEGHSVRAVYMFTAMAELAGKNQDQGLWDACNRLWDNVTQKRMYVTAGIGSTVDGESFSIDYDLPNDIVYAETCASIGLIFWAKRMLDNCPSRKYADVMERALYNGVLSGMQLDGKRFFYVNPLEVNPGISGVYNAFKHVLPERPGWYACACCPPNVARLLTSLGKYIWSESDDAVYAHLFIGGDVELDKANIKVASEFPWKGDITYTVSPKTAERFALAIRIPGYAKETKVTVNGEVVCLDSCKDGYLYLERSWAEGDMVQVQFEMPIRRVYCNTAVRANIGKTAVLRGPLVYCFEGVDNGADLQEIALPSSAELRVGAYDAELLNGIVTIEADGVRIKSGEELYSEEAPKLEPQKLTAIPYYTWGNRGLTQMRVWLPEV